MEAVRGSAASSVAAEASARLAPQASRSFLDVCIKKLAPASGLGLEIR